MSGLIRKLANRSSIKLLILIILLSVFASNSVSASYTIYESFISTEPYSAEFEGENKGAQFGAVLEKGDLNNDGIDDLIVGSPLDSTGAKNWNGRVSVYFGSDDAGRNHSFTPDLNFYGANLEDQLGTSLAVGDFNRDGIDDLAIGAYNAYSNGKRPGKVYLFYGRSDEEWTRKSFILSFNYEDVEFIGNHDAGSFGLSLEAGDLNDDGIDDLLIGAPSDSPNIRNSGAVYTFYGRQNGYVDSVYNMSTVDADILFWGQHEGDRFGSSISVGDVTGDKRTDLLIGAYRSDVDGLIEVGVVNFYRGLTNFVSTVRKPTSIIEGNDAMGWFGFDTEIADVNSDNVGDILISSFPYNLKYNVAQISIFYGDDKFFDTKGVWSIDDRDSSIVEPSGESYLGADILVDHLDDMGNADIVIGAPGIGNPESNESGNVYIVSSERGNLNESYSGKVEKTEFYMLITILKKCFLSFFNREFINYLINQFSTCYKSAIRRRDTFNITKQISLSKN